MPLINVQPDGSGTWVPTLSPKQMAVYDCTDRYVMATGPRLTGKTLAVMHRIIRHAWETPGGRIAMFAKTTKSGLQGVWADIQWAMKEWLDADLGGKFDESLVYTVTPRQDGTRMNYFRIRNYYGEETEIQLHSLDFDGDIEEKLLGTRFSLIYFSELQNFQSRAVFDLSIQQLRIIDLPVESHQWISDTNPPENGTDHFAHKIWFEERTDPVFPPHVATPEEKSLHREWQRNLHLFEFQFEDNPWLDPRQLAALKATYQNDPDAWDRFILGKWTKGGMALRFFPTFRETTHVVGNANGSDESQWDFLNPVPGCHSLYTGWDTGEINHAFAILQKRWDEQGRMCWDILDEVVSVAEELLLFDFASECSEKIDAIEQVVGRPKQMNWTSWADSSLERFSATNPQSAAQIVENVCGQKIDLQFAYEAKSPGALSKRIQFIRKLIFEGRIKVSAHCVNTIKMFKEFTRKKRLPGSNSTSLIRPGDPLKHIFDAISYVIYSEMIDEASIGEADTFGKRPAKAEAPPQIISVLL